MESSNPISFGPLWGKDHYQPIYSSLVEKAGCRQAQNLLDCLRNFPFTVLNNILNTTEFNSGWVPTVDGDFITRFTSLQLADGHFVHVPIISGANSDEATQFAPQGMNSSADIEAYMNTTSAEQWALSGDLLQQMLSTYTSSAFDYFLPSSEVLGGNITLGSPYGPYWRHMVAYFSDAVFVGPRRLTCETWAKANIPAYCYRFNTVPSGATWPTSVAHFDEVAFVFGNLNGKSL